MALLGWHQLYVGTAEGAAVVMALVPTSMRITGHPLPGMPVVQKATQLVRTALAVAVRPRFGGLAVRVVLVRNSGRLSKAVRGKRLLRRHGGVVVVLDLALIIRRLLEGMVVVGGKGIA